MDVRPNKRRTSPRNRSVRAMARGWNRGVIALTSRAGLNAAVGFVSGVVAAIDKFVLHSDANLFIPAARDVLGDAHVRPGTGGTDLEIRAADCAPLVVILVVGADLHNFHKLVFVIMDIDLDILALGRQGGRGGKGGYAYGKEQRFHNSLLFQIK